MRTFGPVPTHAPRPTLPRYARAWLLLAALLGVALLLRLAWLGSFPSNLTADEADNLLVVYGILYGDDPTLFGLDWKPAPAFSMYLAAPFVALFGNTVLGLRLVAALTSVVALLPLYALYRRHTGPVPAVLGLLLLSASVWYLNFSRSGWENVHVVPLTALAFWLLVRALETGKWSLWALSGVTATAGLYSYFAGRAVLFSLLAYAPFALWQHRGNAGRVMGGYALLTLVALALFVPQLPAIQANPAKFNRRAERVSVLEARENYFGREGTLAVLSYQALRNARFFFDGEALGGPSYSPPEQLLQDTRPRYTPFGRPLLDPFTAVLFLVGLVLSLRGGYGMWWVMLLVPWVLTQILTINTPDAARGTGMLPAIYFFVTLALDRAWRWAGGARLLRPALVAAVVLVSAYTTLSYYSWASSPAALRAREPAVPLEQFGEWREAQIERVRADEPFLTVTGWKKLRATGGVTE